MSRFDEIRLRATKLKAEMEKKKEENAMAKRASEEEISKAKSEIERFFKEGMDDEAISKTLYEDHAIEMPASRVRALRKEMGLKRRRGKAAARSKKTREVEKPTNGSFSDLEEAFEALREAFEEYRERRREIVENL